MGLRRSVTIYCDGIKHEECDSSVSGFSYDGAALHVAKEDGWVFQKGGPYLCRGCALEVKRRSEHASRLPSQEGLRLIGSEAYHATRDSRTVPRREYDANRAIYVHALRLAQAQGEHAASGWCRELGAAGCPHCKVTALIEEMENR